jgi:hypothetical protein
VAITDHTRRRIHAAFEEHFGADIAEALMELLPSSGWSDLARSSDITAVRGEIAQVRGELADLRGELKGEIADLRVELKGDMAVLKTEIGDLRVELKGEIADLRESIRTMMPRLALTQMAMSISVTGLALGAARFL